MTRLLKKVLEALCHHQGFHEECDLPGSGVSPRSVLAGVLAPGQRGNNVSSKVAVAPVKIAPLGRTKHHPLTPVSYPMYVMSSNLGVSLLALTSSGRNT